MCSTHTLELEGSDHISGKLLELLHRGSYIGCKVWKTFKSIYISVSGWLVCFHHDHHCHRHYHLCIRKGNTHNPIGLGPPRWPVLIAFDPRTFFQSMMIMIEIIIMMILIMLVIMIISPLPALLIWWPCTTISSWASWRPTWWASRWWMISVPRPSSRSQPASQGAAPLKGQLWTWILLGMTSSPSPLPSSSSPLSWYHHHHPPSPV